MDRTKAVVATIMASSVIGEVSLSLIPQKEKWYYVIQFPNAVVKFPYKTDIDEIKDHLLQIWLKLGKISLALVEKNDDQAITELRKIDSLLNFQPAVKSTGKYIDTNEWGEIIINFGGNRIRFQGKSNLVEFINAIRYLRNEIKVVFDTIGVEMSPMLIENELQKKSQVKKREKVAQKKEPTKTTKVESKPTQDIVIETQDDVKEIIHKTTVIEEESMPDIEIPVLWYKHETHSW